MTCIAPSPNVATSLDDIPVIPPQISIILLFIYSYKAWHYTESDK